MSPDATRNMIQEAIENTKKELNGKIITPKLTPEQEILERASKMEQAAAFKYKQRIKASPIPVTKQEFVESFYAQLRQEFNSFSKDDFATIACMLMASIALSQVQDELI